MRRRTVLRVVSGLAATVLCATTLVAADAVRVAGVYSNLQYNEEGGDLLGVELLIFPSRNAAGYSGLVQIAEGGAPVAFLVPIHVAGVRIEFMLPQGGPYGGLRFSGTVSRTELIGKWSSGTAFGGVGDTERLRRGKSYWQ